MKTKIFFSPILITALLSGCATNEPLTRAEIDNAVYWDQAAYACVQKGYVNHLSAIAVYRNNWNSQLNRGADRATIIAARENNFNNYNWSGISREMCRTVELHAVDAENAARQQRQQSGGGSWIIEPQAYQSQYTSCQTTYGFTNCVSF